MSFKSPGPEQMGHRKDTGNMHIQESSLLEREEEEGNSFDVPKKGGGDYRSLRYLNTEERG